MEYSTDGCRLSGCRMKNMAQTLSAVKRSASRYCGLVVSVVLCRIAVVQCSLV